MKPTVFLTAVAMFGTISLLSGCGESPLGDFEPRLEDIRQGQIGDCGLFAVTGAVSLYHPKLVRKALPHANQFNWVRYVEIEYGDWAGPGRLEGAWPGNAFEFYDMGWTMFRGPLELPEGVPAVACTWENAKVLVGSHCYTVVDHTTLYNPWGFYETVDFQDIKFDLFAVIVGRRY